MNLAIFASGGGSNFRVLLEKIKDNRLLNAHIAVVVSNNSLCGAFNTARQNNIPAVHISARTHPENNAYQQAILMTLKDYKIDLIVLAGYMKLIPPVVIEAYPNRIINIHPALLPDFGGKGMYGIRVHEAVIAAGARESGVTVHYVNSAYDRGAIIARVKVPVEPSDSPEILAARVLKQEHNLYWRVIDHLVNHTPIDLP